MVVLLSWAPGVSLLRLWRAVGMLGNVLILAGLSHMSGVLTRRTLCIMCSFISWQLTWASSGGGRVPRASTERCLSHSVGQSMSQNKPRFRGGGDWFYLVTRRAAKSCHSEHGYAVGLGNWGCSWNQCTIVSAWHTVSAQ